MRPRVPSDLVSELEAQLRAQLLDAIDAQVFSAAQAEVGLRSGACCAIACGAASFPGPFPGDGPAPSGVPIDLRTRFDVASVTKAVVTSTLVMRAVAEQRFSLDTPIAQLLPDAHMPAALGSKPVGALLRHRAGLVDWLPFFEAVPVDARATLEGRAAVRADLLRRGFVDGAQGERYSDLGFILLHWLLEVVYGAGLDDLFAAHVGVPLGLQSAGFVALHRGAQPDRGAVCTEVVDLRGGLVHGVVHDENTWAMGGVSGHAGLFSNATDLGRIARGLLRADAGEARAWLPEEVVGAFWDRACLRDGEHFLYGWDTPSGKVSSAGRTVDREATVGHLGFTGTSLWLDRRRGVYVVLLTNRVHPSRDEGRIFDVRVRVHDLAWTWLDGVYAGTR